MLRALWRRVEEEGIRSILYKGEKKKRIEEGKEKGEKCTIKYL